MSEQLTPTALMEAQTQTLLKINNALKDERDQLKRQVEELNINLETALSQARYLIKSNAKNFDEADQLRAKNAELVKDKERLDWLDSNRGKFIREVVPAINGFQDIRQAIDEARE